MDKIDRALELQVIDWLQWAEFKDDVRPGHGDADKAALALQLISKRKAAYNDLREHADKLASALISLRNEASGLMAAHETVIRMDSGNTNYECVKRRVDQAKEALAEYRAKFPKVGE